MQQYHYLKIFFFLTVLYFDPGTRVYAQDDSVAIAAADTSHFSPNVAEGWQLFNSYVANYQSDSATLELIIQHANNIEWTAEQYVGRIDYQPFEPHDEQNLPFNFSSNNYMLRIDNTGKCYIRLANGALPADDPFIIPLKVFYKL